jgi:hypothetical protein
MTDEKKVEEKKEEEKNEEQILFPEAEVNGITIKPWTFGKLFKVSGMLEKIINKVENKKLDDIFSKDFVSYVELATLFTTLLSEEMLEIIAITLEKPKEEVESFDVGTGVEIAVVIFHQNKSIIKNALAPLLTALSK